MQTNIFAAETSVEEIEEIETIGKRSLTLLQTEIEQAETLMYSHFNELNSSDDYNITCRAVTHAGTHIPTWECDAEHMKHARFMNMMDMQSDMISKIEEEL